MSTETIKGFRAAVNAQKRQWHKVGNSGLCRIYSDAFRDAGHEANADLWQQVADFLDAWHENGRAFWSYKNLDYDEQEPKTATDRRQFVALDCGTSGAFLLEKATGVVWSIRGYGKKNRPIMPIAEHTRTFREATAESLAARAGGA